MPQKNANNPKIIISPNLLPVEAKEELWCRVIEETVRKIAQIFALFLVLLWILGGVLIWKIYQEKNNTTVQLESNIDNNRLLELKKINDQFKELRILNANMEKSLQKEYRFSEVLAELPKITPKGAALTTFETSLNQPGWVSIKGIALNRDDFLKFKQNIEESQFYEKVESPLSNYVTSESVTFELNVLLKNWKPVWEKDVKKKPTTQTDKTTEQNAE